MNVTDSLPGSVISTILKHDAKVTSYKIALLRAINDIVLAFPDMRIQENDVAVPLRMLAEYWVAYYWPFVAPDAPIYQGPRAHRGDVWANDIAFRPQLSALRAAWEAAIGSASRPADGFFIINELRLPRKRISYPKSVHGAYALAIRQISQTLELPIKHAGPGEWTIFARPRRLDQLSLSVRAVPGTRQDDVCLVIKTSLWQTFSEMSLWVEALSIHEWCLFTETVVQGNGMKSNRGLVYSLLTDRPDNRRPLTWERNHVDILIMEGHTFTCPWTERRIDTPKRYDLDHILPVSVYAFNELWNLAPADPYFNSHVKRDRLPSMKRLVVAQPHLQATYRTYGQAHELAQALIDDVSVRFSRIPHDAESLPSAVARAVVDLIDHVAEARNLPRF